MPDISGYGISGRQLELTELVAQAVRIDWGDATPRETFTPPAMFDPVVFDHAYAADGGYTIRARITGLDGGIARERIEVLLALGDTLGLTISGGRADDLMAAGLGADSLSGGRGADLLSGGAGEDILRGGEAADTLIGGQGADTLIGSADLWSDVFVLDAPGEGVDRVRGFEAALDVIHLTSVAPGTPFVAAADPMAGGPGQWLLYDTESGALSFDADGAGDGAPLLLAVLAGAPALTTANLAFGPFG